VLTASAGAADDPRDQLEPIVLGLDLDHHAIDFDEHAVDERTAEQHRIGRELSSGIARVLEDLGGAPQLFVLTVQTRTTASGEYERERAYVEEDREETVVNGTGHAPLMRHPGNGRFEWERVKVANSGTDRCQEARTRSGWPDYGPPSSCPNSAP
jgi:hypothetical protein